MYGRSLILKNTRKNGEFTLKPGEIHSLIGENGAGKSTMMKLLYGMYPIDDGEIYVKGEKMGTITPKTAIEHGIGMVHQEFMLVNELTVLENIILGFEPKKGLTIDFDKARKEVEEYIRKYNMEVQLDKKVSQISVGEAQRVEIIKTLMRGAEIIILDEPTVGIDPQSRNYILEALKKLNEKGTTIIYVSHYMEEIEAICNRIVIMDNGNKIVDQSKNSLKECYKESNLNSLEEIFLHLTGTALREED